MLLDFLLATTFSMAPRFFLSVILLWTLVYGPALDAKGRSKSLYPLALRAPVTAFGSRRKRDRQPNGAAASYSRFSSVHQDDVTIEGQQDRCHKGAEANGNRISPEFEFCDKAISGTKLHRAGLAAMLEAAKAGLFRTLYFYSLSRLARESVIGLPILKRLVYTYKVRVISVTEGLDTDREGWEILAAILLMQHERYVKELSENSFGGQARNVANNFSNGDYCFGFMGEPVAGSENTRRGRHRKPRMRYKIDPIAAEWVKRIFHWFVAERRSIRWIVRELNRLHAPKDHRSTTKHWHHQQVSKLLGNMKHIGLWRWGQMKNVRDPETGIIFQEERPSEETEQWLRRLPELQIVDDETFCKAQQILEDNAKRCAHRHDKEGRFTKDQADAGADNPHHLLSSLIVCGSCGRKFYVGGAFGRYLFCPGYANGSCSRRTSLRRDLAEQLILAQISQKIFDNSAWLQDILDQTIAAWRRQRGSLPNELRDTEMALIEVNRKIQRLIDSIEGDGPVEPEVNDRIAERRAERNRLQGKLAELQQQAERVPEEPNAAWVKEQIKRLHDTLASATPAAAFALRKLVGGSIVVQEAQIDGRKRRFLRGTFRLQLAAVLKVETLDAEDQSGAGEPLGELMTIDFVATNPLDGKAEQVKTLWDQGMLGKEIAAELGCSRAQITKLLKHWEKMHGVKLPNGHARRMLIEQKNKPPLYHQVAPMAHDLMEKGFLLIDIATRLNCDLATATKAINHWRDTHSLPRIDGRARRKGLDRKSRPRDQDDVDGEDSPATG